MKGHNDALSCETVPLFRDNTSLRIFNGFQNGFEITSHEMVGSDFYGAGSFCVLANGDARHLTECGFFLDAARVGHHKFCVFDELLKIEIPHGFSNDEAFNAFELSPQPHGFDVFSCSWMNGKDEGAFFGELFKHGDDKPNPILVVDVRRSVHCHQAIFAIGDAKMPEDRAGVNVRLVLDKGVDHRVADEDVVVFR